MTSYLDLLGRVNRTIKLVMAVYDTNQAFTKWATDFSEGRNRSYVAAQRALQDVKSGRSEGGWPPRRNEFAAVCAVLAALAYIKDEGEKAIEIHREACRYYVMTYDIRGK